MSLTIDQQAAFDAVVAWDNENESRGFFLDGKAGTGKTFLLSQLVDHFLHEKRFVAALAPTHKAVNVITAKLAAAGVPVIELEKSKRGAATGVVYCGTHSSFLGVAPVIVEDQDVEQKFGKVSSGRAQEFEVFPGSAMRPTIVFMDECSMLGKGDLEFFVEAAKDFNLKFIYVGDLGQLPPVKAKPAPFDQARHRYTLTQVVRQDADSEILTLASRVRAKQPYEEDLAAGVWDRDIKVYAGEHASFVQAFLDTVVNPTGLPEEERVVFLAYRNAVVDQMNELACQKAYGHGMEEFRAGERVVAAKPILGPYDPDRGFRPIIAQTNEELDIVDFRDEMSYVYCESTGDSFEAHTVVVNDDKGRPLEFYFLPEKEIENKDHPYRRELESRLATAKDLQNEFNNGVGAIEARLQEAGLDPKGPTRREFWAKRRTAIEQTLWQVDKDRRIAWARFFEWRDGMLAQVRHLFAFTTHKSQGSTFKEVFIDYRDILAYGRGDVKHKSLYVAVTRPRQRVHMYV